MAKILKTSTGKILVTSTGKILVAPDVYTITQTLENATASSSNPTTIIAGGSATLVYTFDGTTYKCPSTAPTITGATGTWTKNSDIRGTLVLSNPTGNITFTISGEANGYTVTLYADGDAPYNILGSEIYDGTSTSGRYLGTFDSYGQEFNITSGNIYCIKESLTSDDRYNGGTGSTGITITNWCSHAPAWLLASVTADGTLTIHEYQH